MLLTLILSLNSVLPCEFKYFIILIFLMTKDSYSPKITSRNGSGIPVDVIKAHAFMFSLL